MTGGELDELPRLPARTLARRFRVAGAVVLIAGWSGAGLIWAFGSRADDPGDFTLTGDSKAEIRQVQTLYGNEGVLMQDWQAALKKPRNQAGIVFVAGALLGAGCFYLARRAERDVG